MPATKQQIRQIIADNNLNSVADVYSLLRDSFKDILQELMEAELDASLGYEKNQKGGVPTSNKRNGHSPKTVKKPVRGIPDRLHKTVLDFRAILNRVALERSTTLNTIELDECYEWWNFRPDNVLQVCEKIKEYEAYFTDMSLNKNGLLKNYLASPLDNPLDELLLYNPSSCFKVCVNDLTGYGYAGCVNKQNRILAIDNLSANKKEVILHEMIHAHEILLEEKSILLRDALLLELYNKLKPIYPTLDQMIKHHANFYRYKQTVADYGEHDILFLLKSLELDDVLKVKPGTVFGYDMDISTI